MNLRDLAYFVAVAELGHFGRAAARLSVSQPTLSMQVKKLERELGAELFERAPRRVLLTPLGQEILVHARQLLNEEEAIRQCARAAGDPLAGELRLGVFPTLAPYILPRLLPVLRKAFPNLVPLLVEDKTALLLGQLEEGTLDAALLALPNLSPRLQTASLFHEKFWLALPAGHKLAKRARVPLSALRDETVLLLDEGHCLRTQSLSLCREIGAGEAQHYRATSLPTLLQMVASGAGVTLVPQLAKEGVGKNILFRPLVANALDIGRSIALFTRKGAARDVLMQALAKQVRGVAKAAGLGVLG